MTTATNPETGETVVLVGDKWEQVSSTATNPKGEKAYLVGDKWIDDKGSKYDPDVSNLRYQVSRAQKGAAGLLALPAEVVYHGGQLLRKGLSQIPGYTSLVPDLPIESPAQLSRRTLGGPEIKAPSRTAEILGGASEFAGAGILPSAAVVGRAAHKIPALLSEIGSTALGGVGSEVAGLPGAIAGSVAGAQTPLAFSKAYSLVSGVVPWLVKQQTSAAPRELVSAIQAHPEAGANVALADEVSANLARSGAGVLRPTLASKTGAPGIIAREQQIAASTPEQLSKYVTRQAENLAVVQRAQQTAFPKGGDIPRAAESLRLSVSQHLESRLDEINRQRQNLTMLLRGRGQQEAGERLTQLRDEAQQVSRNIVKGKQTDVYETADRLGIKEPMDDVLAKVREIGGSNQNIFQNMPPVFGKIISRYAQKTEEATGRSIDPELMAAKAAETAPKPATFQEIHSLWREANTQYGTALRAGNAQAQYYIQQVRDALKAKLNKFESGGFGELTDKFKDFNRFYATKYAPAFKEGVGGKLGAATRYGDLVKPEDVVSKFFTPSGIDDFNLVYGSNPQAQIALADGVVGMFRQSAVKGGKIDPKAAQTFLRNNAETLDKLPDIKAMLSHPAASNEALIEAGVRLKANQREFNKSAVARIANTQNAKTLVDKALTNPLQMRQLVAMASAGGAQSKQAVASMIAERLPQIAEKAGIDPFTFLVQNQQSLKPALDALGMNHFNNLKTIAGAKTVLGRTDMPTTVQAGRIKDIAEELTGTGLPSLISMGRATTITRQSSPVYMLSAVLSKFGIKLREDQTRKMMEEAIYNPEVASAWAKAARTGTLTIGESNRVADHLLSAGIRIESGQE